MKILYLGPNSGTCRQRRAALERLGHEPTHVDPFAVLGGNHLLQSWSFRTGGLGLAGHIQTYVLRAIGGRCFDLCFVDGGELLAPSLVAYLKTRARVVINFNLDNPFTGRDGGRWRLLHQSLRLYDLFITPRLSTAREAICAGVPRVLRVGFAADEIAHASEAELSPPRSTQVAFVGTWMPERGPFLAHLLKRGVPLTITGPRWHKAPEYRRLRDNVVNHQLDDAAYRQSVLGAKIALGLLSKGNRDLHTTRSIEIPALGVLFCGERTADHLSMYEDGKEAVFWDDATECAEQCHSLLQDPQRMAAIAAAGRRRAKKNRLFNEPLLACILAAAERLDSAKWPLVDAWLVADAEVV